MIWLDQGKSSRIHLFQNIVLIFTIQLLIVLYILIGYFTLDNPAQRYELELPCVICQMFN